MTLDVIFRSLGAAALGALATIFTGAFGYWNTDRSHDIEMVRISLSIMQGENKETSLPGRKYALRVLEKYSGIDIPTREFELWAKSGTIPDTVFSTWPANTVTDALGGLDITPNYDKCSKKKLSAVENPTQAQIQNAKLDCYNDFVTAVSSNRRISIRAPVLMPKEIKNLESQ
jgi:hypothetical protein